MVGDLEKRGHINSSVEFQGTSPIATKLAYISHALRSSLGSFFPFLQEQMHVNPGQVPLCHSESPEHPLTFEQIYCASYDGIWITASSRLDTHICIQWVSHISAPYSYEDMFTTFIRRACLALLQGHITLVCQLQLSPTTLATGGSDGRIIIAVVSTFCVKYVVVVRVPTH